MNRDLLKNIFIEDNEILSLLDAKEKANFSHILGDFQQRIENIKLNPGPQGEHGRNPLTVSDTQPENPQIGDLWYQS